MYILTSDTSFPPLSEADEDGLLAIGGDLSTDRLLTAYRQGIFPWYGANDPICWWSPDPRFILWPEKLYVSGSMKKVMRSNQFDFKLNTDFEQVVRRCKSVDRKGEYGTWIQEETVDAYSRLHQLGYAHSGEAWLGDQLVGGMYGVQIGGVFFGESMFATVSNASKFAFISFVQSRVEDGLFLIDCQQETAHLKSLGAELITRDLFACLLDKYC